MLTRVAGRVLVGSAVAVSLWMALPRSSVVGQPSEPLPPPRAGEPKFVGVASCASMACHNFNGPRASFRSEYSTWSAHDKHRQAFLVLYNDRSERIVKNLYGTDAKHATREELCLKCHASGGGKLEGDTLAGAGERFQLSDGVGCESCHGPAEKYLAVHYQRGFKELSAQTKKDRYGLENTKDLASRVALCSRCHVGDGTREVNHDLIAAGHPRLNFEPGAYSFLYNRHWTEEHEFAINGRDYEVRLWLIGQLSTAQAALNLLAARAETADKPADEGGRPWPEFAEYDCYACHKELTVSGLGKEESDRKRERLGKRQPGSFPYGRWYLSMVPPTAAALGDTEVAGKLDRLREMMQAPSPDATAVAKQARATADALGALAGKVKGSNQYSVTDIKRLQKELSDLKGRDANSLSWDEATQLYMSLSSLTAARKDLGDRPTDPARLDAAMGAVRNRLKDAFKTPYGSPELYRPAAGPATLADQLKTLREQLGL